MASPHQSPKLRDIRDLYRPASELGLEDEFPEGPYLHVAEFIPVRRWGQVLPFMRMSMNIYRHSRACPGFLAGGIRAKWWRRQFWSYTVWEDRESMLAFVHAAPHAEAMSLIGEMAAPAACYVEWESDAPPDWTEAMERLRHPTRFLVPPGPL